MSDRQGVIVGHGMVEDDKIVSFVTRDHDEEERADGADDVHHALKHLQHLIGQTLVCGLETVELHVQQNGDTAELGEDHQDEESNSNIVDGLFAGLSLGQELDQEDGC